MLNNHNDNNGVDVTDEMVSKKLFEQDKCKNN